MTLSVSSAFLETLCKALGPRSSPPSSWGSDASLVGSRGEEAGRAWHVPPFSEPLAVLENSAQSPPAPRSTGLMPRLGDAPSRLLRASWPCPSSPVSCLVIGRELPWDRTLGKPFPCPWGLHTRHREAGRGHFFLKDTLGGCHQTTVSGAA